MFQNKKNAKNQLTKYKFIKKYLNLLNKIFDSKKLLVKILFIENYKNIFFFSKIVDLVIFLKIVLKINIVICVALH